MRPSTEVWLGIRHVGDGNHKDQAIQCSAESAVMLMAKFIINNSLATRMEFKIGRDEFDVKFEKRGMSDDLTQTLTNIFAEGEG